MQAGGTAPFCSLFPEASLEAISPEPFPQDGRGVRVLLPSPGRNQNFVQKLSASK